MRTTTLALLLAATVVPTAVCRAAPEPPSGPTLADAENLERNLRWILSRERASAGAEAVVGVYADLGAWHASARSVVDALEKAGLPCRALDRSLVTEEGLKGLRALVLPGGWAPFQSHTLGPGGLAAVRAFVERGGRCVGVCAGAYLLSCEVRWEGKPYPYPLGLFDGLAEGPVEGLANPPAAGPTRLAPTDEGRKRGLGALADQDVLYFGGPRLLGGKGTKVLATYADSTPAIVVQPAGRGEVVLVGPHLERPAVGGAEDGPTYPAIAPALLKALLAPAR